MGITYRNLSTSLYNTLILSAGLALVLGGCAKVSSFKDPAMDESFLGSLAIVPSTKGQVAMYPSYTVSLTGDGKTITIYGITGPLPVLTLTKGAVSGLVAEVVDGKHVKVIDFAGHDDDARAANSKVRGEFILENRELRTIGEHIIISQDVNGVHTDIIKISFKGPAITIL